MNHWIFKSEPHEFGIDDLAAQKKQTARWDGIRNYQARNNLRDLVKQGDRVLFYHSSCKEIGVAGTMEVVKAAYPDPSQFDPNSKYHEPRAAPDAPRWFCVDVRLLEKFPGVIGIKALKADPVAGGIGIFRHTRLSIAPVSASQWEAVLRLARRGGAASGR